MACKHKFLNDLDISYAKGWNTETLIVGTFNPEWSSSNAATWFYGRVDSNHFWDVLPAMYDKPSLICSSIDDRKLFCETNKIAITDLISIIKTAEKSEHLGIISSFSDKAISDHFKLEDLQLTDIVGILNRYPSINHVYLTRGANDSYWKKIWSPIKKHCKTHQISCNELLTPSGYAFYQYTKEERLKHDTLPNFIKSRWKDKWH